MTVTKKQWMMLLLGAGVLFLVYWFFFRKKKSESSYDENLMIFGNENGYTNYQLDGGSLESGYGPEYGAYGSYGYETAFKEKDKTVVVASPDVCDCPGIGDAGKKGFCFKGSGGNLECKTHKLKEPSTIAVRGGGRGLSSESSFRAGATTAATGGGGIRKSLCDLRGGEWGECWDKENKNWYKCCTFNY